MSAIQFDDDIRNGGLEWIRDEIGASPRIRLLTDSKPARPSSAEVGVLVAEITAPTNWLDDADMGAILKLGIWSAPAVAQGEIKYFRIMNAAGTVCRAQGTVTKAITLLTTASTGVGSNVITVADTTGIEEGMGVIGDGVPTNATVFSKTGTTVVFTGASSGIASGAPVTFGDTSGNMQLTSTDYDIGDTVEIDFFKLIFPGA